MVIYSSIISLSPVQVLPKDECDGVFSEENIKKNGLPSLWLTKTLPFGFKKDLSCVGNEVFFKNGSSPVSFYLFSSFQTNITILTAIFLCPSSIQHWDSNPLPLEHESPPITTRPGLPPHEATDLMQQS